MDALRAAGQGSAAGRALLAYLDELHLPHAKAKELAERILGFAKASSGTGQGAAGGKENVGKDGGQPEEAAAATTVEGAQLLAPRGKHDLLFFKTFLRLRGSKQAQDVPYASIQHIAIFEPLPKEKKKHVLLFLHVARDGQAKGKAGADAVVIQVEQSATLDIASPAAGAARLSGPAAVVYCQAFGAMGVAPTAFVAPAPDVFSSAAGAPAVEAVVGASQGLLFPLQSAFCFLQKPALWVSHADVAAAELLRAGGGSSTFDLRLARPGGKALEFANIDRSELAALASYLARSGLQPAAEGGGSSQGGGSGGSEAQDGSSDEEDADFDPRESGSEGGGAAAAAEGSGASEGEAGASGSSSGDGSDADSDVSVVSEEGLRASGVRALVDQAKRPARKRRRS